MANLFGKDCGPKVFNDSQEPAIDPTDLSLKKDHVFVGNTEAKAEETKLDPERFEVEDLDCENSQLTIKPFKHDELLELEDDDHPQYVHNSIAREVTADHIFSGDPEFSGEPEFSGLVRDSAGNVGTLGQVPVTKADGRFEWKTQKVENVLWVSKDGSDDNDGLTPQTAKASIKAAVRASHSGDLGKVMDAAESILANKKLIIEETISELYTQDFQLPSSTAFDLKSRQAYRLIMQNRDDIVSGAIAEVSATNPAFSDAGGSCTRDSRMMVLALAKSILFGGYDDVKRFIGGYFNANGQIKSGIFSPSTELSLTISTFNLIRDRIKAVLSSSTYLYIRGKIDTLVGYITTSLLTNSLVSIPSPEDQSSTRNRIYYSLDELVEDVWEATALSFPTVTSTELTCKRDIRLVAIAVAEDINSWGTSNLIQATRSYFETVGIFATSIERQASAYAYTELRNTIRTYTTNPSIRAHIDLTLNFLINALTSNSVSGAIDADEGVVNKSGRICNRDLGLFIDAVASDMKNGGNVFSVEFAEGYYEGNNLIFITNELSSTIWALNRARELMILSMKNWRTNSNGDVYTPRFSLEKIYIDNSIVFDPWPACANAETAINNYYGIVQYILENGPNATAKEAKSRIYTDIGRGDDPNSVVNAVWRETSIAYPNVQSTETKCRRDLILVLEAVAEDLYSTGNSNTLRVTRAYFEAPTNPVAGQVTESVYAFNLARDYVNNNLLTGSEFTTLRSRVTTLMGILTSALVAGNLNSLPVEDSGTWTIQQPTYKTTIFVNPGVYWEDNPISLPPNTVVTGDSLRGITVNAMNRTLDLFHVNNACGLSFMTFSNHLAPSWAVAFPKKNNQGVAGIISRSPYVQQCTSITTTGGGMLVDGAITEGFKSMVLDSYTQYNQGGPGVKIINNGYAQLVSLFTISCTTGIECAKGGQCDLTNSNSSLGDYGLVADGLGDVEIVGRVVEDVDPGEDRVKIKLDGKLKPYNGQAGFFGAPYYSIQEIKVIDGGRGYESPPIITISEPEGPLGIPARARAVLDNGAIESITMLKNGTSYIAPPVVIIAPPTGVDGIPATVEVVVVPLYYRVVTSTPIAEDNTTTITLVSPTLYRVTKGTSFILSRQSKVLASGHSFEYIGAGPNIRTALPIRNGIFIQQQEVEERRGGSVIFTSTDQSGNFRIGDGVIIDQASGTIGGVSFSRGLFAQITPLILALQ